MITASHGLSSGDILVVALAASVIPVLALILSMVYVNDRFRKIEGMIRTLALNGQDDGGGQRASE